MNRKKHHKKVETPDRGAVRGFEGSINNKIVVEIKDYGIGMEKDEIEKAFERFYQIDKSHSSEGSGLGLAIVKRIIEG